jgi:hypothetical protein
LVTFVARVGEILFTMLAEFGHDFDGAGIYAFGG